MRACASRFLHGYVYACATMRHIRYVCMRLYKGSHWRSSEFSRKAEEKLTQHYFINRRNHEFLIQNYKSGSFLNGCSKRFTLNKNRFISQHKKLDDIILNFPDSYVLVYCKIF